MLYKRRLQEAGITLVEIVTVLGIIALLSAVAIPQYKKFSARARMAEAKKNLKAIHVMQLTFQGENSRFAIIPPTGNLRADVTPGSGYDCPANELGWSIAGCGNSNKVRYLYQAPDSGDANRYTATARGMIVEGCNKVDIWAIDENGVLRHTADAALTCR